MIFWKKFNKNYEVSNEGDIRSIDRYIARSDTGTLVFYKSKLQKAQVSRCGYLLVRLSIDNVKETVSVHREVAKAFIPNPDAKPQVNHKDGNKKNNHINNLEWCTNSENQIHANALGLNTYHLGKQHHFYEGEVTAWKDGQIIAVMNGNIDMANKGFDFRLVSACLLGKRNTHRGCTFTKQFIKGN